MVTEVSRELAEALAAATLPRCVSAEGARVSSLAGLTNRVYKVETAGRTLCLRIPGEGAAELIDREAEAANSRAAAAAGVSPAVLHFGADGVMLTQFVEDAVSLSPRLFETRPGAIERAAAALAQLHRTAQPFANNFDAFSFVKSYAAALRLDPGLPQDFEAAIAEAEGIRLAFESSPVQTRPCHCDPTGPNLLDTGERVWIVDWEFSGMNDPMWDLAYLSVEGRFDDQQDRRLLRTYFERKALPGEVGRMALQKVVVDLVAALWCLMQDARGNRGADFLTEATDRLRRCRARMAAPVSRAASERRPRLKRGAIDTASC